MNHFTNEVHPITRKNKQKIHLYTITPTKIMELEDQSNITKLKQTCLIPLTWMVMTRSHVMHAGRRHYNPA